PAVATREAPLENRTALCLAPQLPPRGHPLGATRRELPGHGAARLCPALAPGIYEIAFSFAQVIPLISNVEDDVVACFQHGGGVPYSSYKRFPEVMRELSTPTFDTLLVDKILPLVPGLVESLRQGIDVLEVGCGSGRAINVMARGFRGSRVFGYDLIREQIVAANAEAAAWGLSNARFEVKDVSTLDEKAHYDLVTAFDTVH